MRFGLFFVRIMKEQLLPEIRRALAEIGIEEFTPIQNQSLPPLLEGRDLLGQSATGSGKTIAFALPLLQKIRLQERKLQALVICPTRELCQQVVREIRKLGRHFPGLSVLPLVGGEPFGPQQKSLHHGLHVAVGTPGRLLDHLQRQTIDFSELRYVVLDEADRMLEMGFQEDVEQILLAAPPSRQTVLFSATFPEQTESLSERYQKNPVKVVVETSTKLPSSIEQFIYEIAQEEKVRALLTLLAQQKPETALVFCHLKATVAELTQALEESNMSVACLHGDMDQTDRNRVMALCKNGSVRVVVATDVAARGIDVNDLDLVVNYDFPKPEIYVHRIGRTGRAGKKGVALSLVEPREKHKVRALEEELAIRLTLLDLPEALPPFTKPAQMCTLYIGGGRKEKMRPGDILGALTGAAGGLTGQQVGKIEVHDHFSYVAIQREVAEQAFQRLKNGQIKGRKFRVEKVL